MLEGRFLGVRVCFALCGGAAVLTLDSHVYGDPRRHNWSLKGYSEWPYSSSFLHISVHIHSYNPFY